MSLKESLTITLTQMTRPNTLSQGHLTDPTSMKLILNHGRQKIMLRMHTKNRTTTPSTSTLLIII